MAQPRKAGTQRQGAPRQQPPSRPSAASRARSRAAAERARRARINRHLGFAALIAVLVVVVVVGMKFVIARIGERDDVATAVPTNDYKPVKCTPERVHTSLTPKATQAGRPVVFEVTLQNTSTSNPCYIDVGWSNVDVQVTSGSTHIASIAACHKGAESKRLLLDRKYTATAKLTWNGGVAASGCGDTSKSANSGTYKAELTFKDNTAAKAQASFALDQPAPQPSQNPGESGEPSGGSGDNPGGGQTPNGGQTPDNGKQTHENGGQTPGNGKQTPSGSQTPEGGQTPGGGQRPGNGQVPGNQSQNPGGAG